MKVNLESHHVISNSEVVQLPLLEGVGGRTCLVLT